MPPFFKEKKFKKGQKLAKESNGVLATRWKDKRDVFMLSTIHKDVMVDTDDGRPVEHRGGHQTVKPVTVTDYNANKVGVDRQDQAASYYPFARKTLKWWKKLFSHLFITGVIHAHKFYQISNKTKIPLRAFLLEVTDHLIAKAGIQIQNDPMVALPARLQAPLRSKGLGSGDHFPVKLPGNVQRQCVHCPSSNRDNAARVRKRSGFLCMECKVCLCVICFHPYHRPHARST